MRTKTTVFTRPLWCSRRKAWPVEGGGWDRNTKPRFGSWLGRRFLFWLGFRRLSVFTELPSREPSQPPLAAGHRPAAPKRCLVISGNNRLKMEYARRASEHNQAVLSQRSSSGPSGSAGRCPALVAIIDILCGGTWHSQLLYPKEAPNRSRVVGCFGLLGSVPGTRPYHSPRHIWMLEVQDHDW